MFKVEDTGETLAPRDKRRGRKWLNGSFWFAKLPFAQYVFSSCWFYRESITTGYIYIYLLQGFYASGSKQCSIALRSRRMGATLESELFEAVGARSFGCQKKELCLKGLQTLFIVSIYNMYIYIYIYTTLA